MLARLLNQSGTTIDRVFQRAITGRSTRSRAQSKSESLDHAGRMVALAAIRARYAPLAADTDAFFGKPEARRFEIVAKSTRRTKEGEYERLDVRWASRVEPAVNELRSAYLSTPENHLAAARLLRGPRTGRPVAILVHGYLAGQYAVEERIWPIDWLLDHGLDVALYVLPFHAVRRAPGLPIRFPGSDPRFTIEGFRQAIGDLRDLRATFQKDGARATIAMGFSLGGYTTALFATTEALDFAAPIIPLASFADVAREAGRLVGTADEQRTQHAAIEAAHAVVSPLGRSPRTDGRRMIVAGAEGDHITPIPHAEKLAAHFGARKLVRFPGGHLAPFGRRVAFKAIGARLRELGVFA